MKRAIIVGSAPCAADMRHADLSEFTTIAINKSWALRDDFDIHVGLKFMQERHDPPAHYKTKRIRRHNYKPHIDKAGGEFLCAPSVALIAGYWAVNAMPFKTITYYGCDLVFDPAKNNGRTHFYGVSDKGPLFNKHPCMRRQDLKSARLFVWALMHRTLLLNGSNLTGSLLAFPPGAITADHNALFDFVIKSTLVTTILALGQKAFLFEHSQRIAAFDAGWRPFAKNAAAVALLDDINKQWEPVKALCDELKAELAAWN